MPSRTLTVAVTLTLIVTLTVTFLGRRCCRRRKRDSLCLSEGQADSKVDCYNGKLRENGHDEEDSDVAIDSIERVELGEHGQDGVYQAHGKEWERCKDGKEDLDKLAMPARHKTIAW